MTVPIKRSCILIILLTILASSLASCAGKVESQTSTNQDLRKDTIYSP